MSRYFASVLVVDGETATLEPLKLLESQTQDGARVEARFMLAERYMDNPIAQYSAHILQLCDCVMILHGLLQDVPLDDTERAIARMEAQQAHDMRATITERRTS